jgi:hypothetical protein
MLALFTIPKPFLGTTAVAQVNALQSWRALGPDLEIFVFGDEDGSADAAAAVGAQHVPEIPRNEWGTPLVSHAFTVSARLATAEWLCYANADVILLADLPTAVRQIGELPALIVGARVDVDLSSEIDFGPGWEDRLRRSAGERGKMGTEREIDYLVFPRKVDWNMPPLAVGRPGWDNWVLYRARSLGLSVVDATGVVLAIHQRHGYDHVPGRRGPRWQGPEAEVNRALVAEMGTAYGLFDATHVLTADGLVPARGLRYLKRRARRHRLLGRGVKVVDTLRR